MPCCPQNLDFDFEKCCSVSLSRVNVYVCLVCGRYFQGRGQATHAYTHALEAGHHMFMKLEDGRVYCLPDMYQVVDRSLADVQFVLNPTFAGRRACSCHHVQLCQCSVVVLPGTLPPCLNQPLHTGHTLPV